MDRKQRNYKKVEENGIFPYKKKNFLELKIKNYNEKVM